MRRDPATGWRVPREPGQYVAFAGLKRPVKGLAFIPRRLVSNQAPHKKVKEAGKEDIYGQELAKNTTEQGSQGSAAAADGGGICFPRGQWNPPTATHPKAPETHDNSDNSSYHLLIICVPAPTLSYFTDTTSQTRFTV